MAEVVDICQNKVVGRKYKMCGNCKCPHRLAHSTTAVECAASTNTCPYTATATATAQCDTSVLSQPECAHIKTHPFFADNCGSNNQVAVQCNAQSRSTVWSAYTPCRSATGRFCAAYDGEMGSQTRQRYAGCGTACSLENEAQQCALPFTPAVVTYTAWVEVQCAKGTGLGRMQRTKTVTNTCTGESVETVEEQGEDVSLLLNRFMRTLSRDCPANAKCGSADGNVAYQEYTVFDRCLLSSSTERGDACRINVCPYFSAWQPWEACSKSCGEGVRRRIRYCVGGEVGEGYCRAGKTGGAELVQTASCNRVSISTVENSTVQNLPDYFLTIKFRVTAATGNGQVGPDAATTVLSAVTSDTDSNATVVLMRWSANKETALPTRFKPVPPFKLNPLLSALTAKPSLLLLALPL